MKRRSRNGTNTAHKTTQRVRGTGKSQATSPSHTHKPGGAIRSPRKSKGPLDNRGKDNDRKRMG